MISPDGLVVPAAWTAYTPTLTASTTNPTMGTGSVVSGYYMQIGKIVFYRFYLSFGTGMTAGTGSYEISLPVTAAATGGAGPNTVGSLFIYDSSANIAYTGLVGNVGTNTAKLTDIYYAQGTTLTAMGAAAPWTWAVSDQIRGAIVYEAA